MGFSPRISSVQLLSLTECVTVSPPSEFLSKVLLYIRSVTFSTLNEMKWLVGNILYEGLQKQHKSLFNPLLNTTASQCGNVSNQDCRALRRVVRLSERISGSALPSLQDIYLKHCKSRAAKIIKDSTHPGNHLFCLLPSGKRFRSMMAKTERLRRSFFPQAIRILNSNSTS